MTTPTFTAPPTPPARSDPAATFVARADAWNAWVPTFSEELEAGVEWMNDTANDVAAEAAVAIGAAGAIAWVSGTSYVTGDVRYSPINFLAYRRKTNGAGTTDPSLDTTNWALAAGQGDVLQADLTALRAFAIAAAAAL